MITYRYGPYRPGDDGGEWDLEKLSRILSDMIMRYDIGIEEALRMLIERGLPVSLFLAEAGMADLIRELAQLLENQGVIVRDEGDGGLKLSPASVRRIGRRALESIFGSLRADGAGGSHSATEPGESENVSSITRPYNFGDPLSGIDMTSSILNSLIRKGYPRPGTNDLELFEARGESKSATVVLLDMSGSMMRDDRFYNAKQVALALDSLIRQEYRDDRLTVVGFGSLAKTYSVTELVSLQPFPITMYDPHMRLRFNMGRMNRSEIDRIPLYFTNLQRGLSLSRRVLGSRETRNRQIILITDGVPTAHMENETLCVNYPPSPADFDFALREVNGCREDDIVINTFLLTSDWERSYFGEDSFITGFAKRAHGRIFYPRPNELDRMVLVDFINNKKSFIN